MIKTSELVNVYAKYISRKGYAEDNKLHASSAGHCFKKHWYRIRNTERDPTDDSSLINMHTGILLHEDMQKSLGMLNKIISTECQIEIPRLNVVGKYDIVELEGRNVWIYDIKSLKAYSWKKKFGRKENRDDNPSDKYPLQLGTYGLAFRDMGYNVSGLYIINFKKDDGAIKVEEIDTKYVDLAEEYWQDANKIIKLDKEPIPANDPGVPFESWECNYCQYASKCGSPYAK